MHLAVPDDLADVFAHEAGQHVTIVRDGGRRGGPPLVLDLRPGAQRRARRRRAAPARAGGSRASSPTGCAPGTVLDVLPPAGPLRAGISPGVSRHHAFVAAGSGITPVISIVATVLAEEPGSRCTVLYGNRRTDTIMFLEELEDLKNRYPSRLQLVHVLSRESAAGAAAGGAPGRRPARCAARRAAAAGRRSTSGTSAGRSGWCRTPARCCASAASPRSTSTASCSTPTPSRSPRRAAQEPATEPRRSRSCSTGGARRSRVDGGSILEAALRNRPDAPYACKGGVCGTCRCRIVEGEVAMDHSYALEDDEVDAGVVLACQAHPRSERIVLDFDAR